MKREDELMTEPLSDWELDRLEAEEFRQQIELEDRERFLEQQRREEDDRICRDVIFQKLNLPTDNLELYLLHLFVEARDMLFVLVLVALAVFISESIVDVLLKAFHFLTQM